MKEWKVKEEVIKRLTDNLEVNHRTDPGSQVEQAIWQREEILVRH